MISEVRGPTVCGVEHPTALSPPTSTCIIAFPSIAYCEFGRATASVGLCCRAKLSSKYFRIKCIVCPSLLFIVALCIVMKDVRDDTDCVFYLLSALARLPHSRQHHREIK
ncbi:hypothetical protein ACHAWO_004046 [Cyclotella atomus]|uniref:Transmembrane protein n=1 Tax=Cyclotella atomus TaxID=382360 RepID=A0ABD3NWJ1_9STRA